MAQFAIIEVEDGLTVAEVKPGEKPEDAAIREGGLLIDPGPYATFEEATDAMIDLQAEEEDERE